ncbi:MAG: AAA family ATPase, partial [Anaerolineae bacterium]
MSSQKPRTYQDLLQRRQQSEFVGREDQIAQFRRNLGYALDDERRRFIFNVHGPGGVGKTWLLRRCFEPIAQERGLLTAYSDEEQSDVLQVMGCLARQLAAQGHPLETFAARYRTYEERRHEIGADPHTPSFPPLDLARAPDRIRRRRTRRPPAPRLTSRQRRRNRLLSLLVTGFDEEELRTLCFSLDVDHDSLRGEGKEGKARELVALLDRQERLDELVHAGAEQRPHLDWHAPPDSPLQRAAFEGDLAGEVALGPRDEFAAYVTRQLRDPQAARLVLGPMQALTPPFLQDLAALAAQRPLLLCFDTYEHMGAFLDPWLREVVRGERYGALAAEVLLVVAGREELERQSWAPLEGLVARVPLAPFTEQEARDYLARKGVTHEPVIEVILRLSGRLPLLVSTLAAQSPADPAQVGDPSGEAVARFLKWVEDPRRKQVALDAALPRHLNQDVLALLAGDEEAGALFDWLRGQPFVRKRGESWTYHPVVREHLLRYKRQRTPQGWANLHGQLAAHYERLRDDTGLEPEAGRKDATWQAHALEALYHSLCESPPRNLPVALNGFALALKAGRALARRWAETMQQAGEDAQA